MFNKKLERLQAAFENLTEGVEEQEVIINNIPTTVDVIDYIDQDDNLYEINKAVTLQTLAMNELSSIINNVDSLSKVVESNNNKIEEGNVRAQDVLIANEALSRACVIFGYEKPIVCSFESIGQNPLEALRVTNEGIGETISKGFEAIIKFFKNLFIGIWNFIKGIFKDEKLEQAKKNNEEAAKWLENYNKEKEDISKMLSDAKIEINIDNVSNIEEAKKIIEENTPEHKLRAYMGEGMEILQDIKMFGKIAGNDIKTMHELVNKIIEFSDVFKVEELEQQYNEHTTKYNVQQLLSSLKMDENKTTDELMKELISNREGFAPAIGSIEKQLGYHKVSMDKALFKDIIEYVENEEKQFPTVICKVDRDFRDEIKNLYKNDYSFKILVTNFTLTSNKIKAHSKIFINHVPNGVTSKLEYTYKDLFAILTTDIETYRAFYKNMDKVLNTVPAVNKYLVSSSEKMVKQLEDIFKEIESKMNNTTLRTKVDISSYLSMLKNMVQFETGEMNTIIDLTNSIVKISTHVKRIVDKRAKYIEGYNAITDFKKEDHRF